MLLKCTNTPMSQVAFNEKDKTAWLYEMSNVQNTGSNHWLKMWNALFHPSTARTDDGTLLKFWSKMSHIKSGTYIPIFVCYLGIGKKISSALSPAVVCPWKWLPIYLDLEFTYLILETILTSVSMLDSWHHSSFAKLSFSLIYFKWGLVVWTVDQTWGDNPTKRLVKW